ncbi:MAG: sulfotransferase family 2 domain-containing protein [Pseudomonadota bacterium]
MKPAIFLHIQKTAGTSVQEIARAHYEEGSVCSHGEFLSLGQTGCSEHSFISGHFGIAFAKPFLRERYSFTFLRDPVERVVSLYSYLSKRDDDQSQLADFAKKLDLKSFVMRAKEPEFAPKLWNHQVWQLYHGWVSFDMGQNREGKYITQFIDQDETSLLEGARANLEQLDYVGFADSFDHDIREIFQDLGADNIDVPLANTSASHLLDMDSETRETIEEVTKLDRMLIEGARAKRA